MSKRYEYWLDLSKLAGLSAPAPDERLQIRPAQPADLAALGELMLEAYRGTIDDEGETLGDAIGEVQAYLAGGRGGPLLLDHSRLGFAGDRLVSACLAAEWTERQRPLIAYVMTRAGWKGHGAGKQILWAVLRALAQQEYGEVLAVITAGNTPSERLFTGFGFKR